MNWGKRERIGWIDLRKRFIARLEIKGFANITEARKWVLTFTQWYNHEHRHSGLNFITPQHRHTGKDKEIFENRPQVYEKAKTAHPEPWSGEIRDWTLVDEVWLNPERSQTIYRRKNRFHKLIHNYWNSRQLS